jgi:chemotaxis protein MotA
MNRASIIGIFMGVAAILIGNIIEGGRIHSIVQGSAAIIVFGGTLGATFLSFSTKDIIVAGQMLRGVFFEDRMLPKSNYIIDQMVNYLTKARREGILSLDDDIQSIDYVFFRRAMRMAIDGVQPNLLQSTLEQENRTFEAERSRAAKVFEAAGGFAPTIGIIGAVLGLIHVMENLSDPTRLGSGIAVAFVATIYGVASANLIFLPIAKKLARHEMHMRDMIIEGVLAIQAGRNPFYLREHLNSFL